MGGGRNSRTSGASKRSKGKGRGRGSGKGGGGGGGGSRGGGDGSGRRQNSKGGRDQDSRNAGNSGGGNVKSRIGTLGQTRSESRKEVIEKQEVAIRAKDIAPEEESAKNPNIRTIPVIDLDADQSEGKESHWFMQQAASPNRVAYESQLNMEREREQYSHRSRSRSGSIPRRGGERPVESMRDPWQEPNKEARSLRDDSREPPPPRTGRSPAGYQNPPPPKEMYPPASRMSVREDLLSPDMEPNHASADGRAQPQMAYRADVTSPRSHYAQQSNDQLYQYSPSRAAHLRSPSPPHRPPPPLEPRGIRDYPRTPLEDARPWSPQRRMEPVGENVKQRPRSPKEGADRASRSRVPVHDAGWDADQDNVALRARYVQEGRLTSEDPYSTASARTLSRHGDTLDKYEPRPPALAGDVIPTFRAARSYEPELQIDRRSVRTSRERGPSPTRDSLARVPVRAHVVDGGAYSPPEALRKRPGSPSAPRTGLSRLSPRRGASPLRSNSSYRESRSPPRRMADPSLSSRRDEQLDDRMEARLRSRSPGEIHRPPSTHDADVGDTARSLSVGVGSRPHSPRRAVQERDFAQSPSTTRTERMQGAAWQERSMDASFSEPVKDGAPPHKFDMHLQESPRIGRSRSPTQHDDRRHQNQTRPSAGAGYRSESRRSQSPVLRQEGWAGSPRRDRSEPISPPRRPRTPAQPPTREEEFRPPPPRASTTSREPSRSLGAASPLPIWEREDENRVSSDSKRVWSKSTESYRERNLVEQHAAFPDTGFAGRPVKDSEERNFDEAMEMQNRRQQEQRHEMPQSANNLRRSKALDTADATDRKRSEYDKPLTQRYSGNRGEQRAHSPPSSRPQTKSSEPNSDDIRDQRQRRERANTSNKRDAPKNPLMAAVNSSEHTARKYEPSVKPAWMTRNPELLETASVKARDPNSPVRSGENGGRKRARSSDRREVDAGRRGPEKRPNSDAPSQAERNRREADRTSARDRDFMRRRRDSESPRRGRSPRRRRSRSPASPRRTSRKTEVAASKAPAAGGRSETRNETDRLPRSREKDKQQKRQTGLQRTGNAQNSGRTPAISREELSREPKRARSTESKVDGRSDKHGASRTEKTSANNKPKEPTTNKNVAKSDEGEPKKQAEVRSEAKELRSGSPSGKNRERQPKKSAKIPSAELPGDISTEEGEISGRRADGSESSTEAGATIGKFGKHSEHQRKSSSGQISPENTRRNPSLVRGEASNVVLGKAKELLSACDEVMEDYTDMESEISNQISAAETYMATLVGAMKSWEKMTRKQSEKVKTIRSSLLNLQKSVLEAGLSPVINYEEKSASLPAGSLLEATAKLLKTTSVEIQKVEEDRIGTHEARGPQAQLEPLNRSMISDPGVERQPLSPAVVPMETTDTDLLHANEASKLCEMVGEDNELDNRRDGQLPAENLDKPLTSPVLMEMNLDANISNESQQTNIIPMPAKETALAMAVHSTKNTQNSSENLGTDAQPVQIDENEKRTRQAEAMARANRIRQEMKLQMKKGSHKSSSDETASTVRQILDPLVDHLRHDSGNGGIAEQLLLAKSSETSNQAKTSPSLWIEARDVPPATEPNMTLADPETISADSGLSAAETGLNSGTLKADGEDQRGSERAGDKNLGRQQNGVSAPNNLAAGARATDVTSATGTMGTEGTSAAGTNGTEGTSASGAIGTEVTLGAGANGTEVTLASGAIDTEVTSASGAIDTEVTLASGAIDTEVTLASGAIDTEVTSASGAIDTELTAATGTIAASDKAGNSSPKVIASDEPFPDGRPSQLTDKGITHDASGPLSNQEAFVSVETVEAGHIGGLKPNPQTLSAGDSGAGLNREQASLNAEEAPAGEEVSKEFRLHRGTRLSTATDLLRAQRLKAFARGELSLVDLCRNQINPNLPMCPYELHGKCLDEDCPYQHFRDLDFDKNPTGILEDCFCYFSEDFYEAQAEGIRSRLRRGANPTLVLREAMLLCGFDKGELPVRRRQRHGEPMKPLTT